MKISGGPLRGDIRIPCCPLIGKWIQNCSCSHSYISYRRYRFSDESGRIERGKDEAQLPSANWSWESSRWVIHENFGGVLLGPEVKLYCASKLSLALWLMVSAWNMFGSEGLLRGEG